MTRQQKTFDQAQRSLQPGFAFGGYVENILKGSFQTQNHIQATTWSERFDNPASRRDLDDKRMALALMESMKGVGTSSPNPAVGCAVFKENTFLFSSHTQPYGGLHAERNALALQGLSVFPEESEVYVTLEPCSHHGKTPPCVELFSASQNIRVIVASEDPNPLVGGQGLEKIKNRGLSLSVGTLGSEVRATLLPFLKWVSTKEPFIGLKWAQSIDGKLADFQNSSQWLTGDLVKNYTFWLRQKYDCIAVGFGTFIHDHPALTVRAFHNEIMIRNPLRIVLDPLGKFLKFNRTEQIDLLETKTEKTESEPLKSSKDMFDSMKQISTPWIVVSGSSAENCQENTEYTHLNEHLLVTLSQEKFLEMFKRFLKSDELIKRNSGKQVQSLLVEGGAKIHSMFVSKNMYDILHVYQAPILLGGTVHTVTQENNLSKFPLSLSVAPRLHLLQSFNAGYDTVTEFLTHEAACSLQNPPLN